MESAKFRLNSNLSYLSFNVVKVKPSNKASVLRNRSSSYRLLLLVSSHCRVHVVVVVVVVGTRCILPVVAVVIIAPSSIVLVVLLLGNCVLLIVTLTGVTLPIGIMFLFVEIIVVSCASITVFLMSIVVLEGIVVGNIAGAVRVPPFSLETLLNRVLHAR